MSSSRRIRGASSAIPFKNSGEVKTGAPSRNPQILHAASPLDLTPIVRSSVPCRGATYLIATLIRAATADESEPVDELVTPILFICIS